MKQSAIIDHALYRYYYPILLRYLTYMLKNRDEAAALANEILQEQLAIDTWENAILKRRLKQALQLYSYYYMQARIFNKPMIQGYLPARENKIKQPSPLI